MDYTQFFIWAANRDLDATRRFLNENKPKIVEYFVPEEWDPNGINYDFLYEYAELNDCEVRILINSHNRWNSDIYPKKKNVLFEQAPTLCFDYGIRNYTAGEPMHFNMSNSNDIYSWDIPYNKQISYNVISMTNHLKPFRSKMIDQFALKGIICHRNYIIWNNRSYGGEYNYQYQYFDGNPIIDPDFGQLNGFNHAKLPKMYDQCFLAAVSETSTDIAVITEKVITPILFLKPFIVLGDRGYHQFLKSLGFELFEEFIDYSFDFEHNEDRRIEMFSDQVAKVSAFSNDELINLTRQVSWKLKHNKTNFYRIYRGSEYKPKYVNEWLKYKPADVKLMDSERDAQAAWYEMAARRGWNV
jgi:hypothetical protein